MYFIILLIINNYVKYVYSPISNAVQFMTSRTSKRCCIVTEAAAYLFHVRKALTFMTVN